jgi:hypothetical protein
MMAPILDHIAIKQLTSLRDGRLARGRRLHYAAAARAP